MAYFYEISLILTLISLASAGPSLPLKEGTSVQALVNSTFKVMENFRSDVLKQVNSSLSNWTYSFSDNLKDAVQATILDPFVDAYNKEMDLLDEEVLDKNLLVDVNATALEVADKIIGGYMNFVSKTAGDIFANLSVILNAMSEFVAAVFSSVDTTGLMNVDLSRVDMNVKGFTDIISANVKITDDQLSMPREVRSVVESLPKSMAAAGKHTAKYLKSIIRYLNRNYPMSALLFNY